MIRVTKLLVPIAGLGLVAAGCGTVSAQSHTAAAPSTSPSATMTAKAATTSSMSSSMSNQAATPNSSGGSLVGLPSDVLVGAAANAGMGGGNGMLTITSVGMKHTWKVPLGKGVTAFQAAISGQSVYVPTTQGKTYIVSLKSHKVLSSFSSPKGADIGTVAEANHLLIITGSNSVTAYSIPSMKEVWQINQGGHTLAVAGHDAYLSGLMSSKTTVIDVRTGHIVTTVPVGMVEDSVYDPERHTLWLANWNTGDMTVLNTRTNRVVKTIQRKEGGGFSMSNMMNSPGGFMQLAVGPSGRSVYAASFSGNIMVYNATANIFAKDIAVKVPMAKLSGLAVDPSGRYAYATVESHQETVSIALNSGRITGTQSGLVSNRWYTAHS